MTVNPTLLPLLLFQAEEFAHDAGQLARVITCLKNENIKMAICKITLNINMICYLFWSMDDGIGLVFLRQARVDARLFDADAYRVVLDHTRQWFAAMKTRTAV